MMRTADSRAKLARLLHLWLCLDRSASGPGHPSDWRLIEPTEDHSQACGVP